jgi:hypothetical protein
MTSDDGSDTMWPLLRKILPLLLVAIYVLSPVDLVPDFLVGLGWIDDLILVGFLIWFLSGRSIPLFGRFGSPFGRDQREDQRTSRRTSYSSTRQNSGNGTTDDPHVILGVRPGATAEEIREAYRVAALKYHPDKVTHLGKEFQELAHRRFLAIQEAYERLMKR